MSKTFYMKEIMFYFMVLLLLFKLRVFQFMIFWGFLLAIVFMNIPLTIINIENIFLVFFIDNMSILLMFLVLLFYYWFYWFFLDELSENNEKHILLKVLLLIISLVFISSKLISFYIFFEMTLIPIFFIILGFGYQPERKVSSMLMFLYTIMFSLPLLWIVIFLGKNYFLMSFLDLKNFNFCSNLESLFESVISFWLMMGFLVKLPMFFFHMWLPKAHVESPVEGSMILASVMLKLGVVGLLRFECFFFLSSFFFKLLLFLSLLGGGLACLLALIQVDIKSVIAYSSIGHMSIIVGLILINYYTSITYIMILSLVHGLISPLMFYYTYMLYENSNSRNFLMNSNLKSWGPGISFFFFLGIMLNMSAPPSLSLLVEIYAVFSFFNESLMLMILLSVILYFGVVFNINFYCNITKGKEKNMSLKLVKSFDFFTSKLFLSLIPLMMSSMWLFF